MILPRSFYSRDAITVARELLGNVLAKGETAGIITETEAYPGGEDLASHSAAGLTNRTRVIFGPPGHAYVYLSYGMHVCMNIVTLPEGVAGCVLIRALEPVAGIEIMRGRRPAARNDRDLASGPGKLTQALGITLADYGADLTSGDFVVRTPARRQPFRIEVTPRIGITKCADLPLRFLLRRDEVPPAAHRNMRMSNSNGLGSQKAIREKSGCAGFSKTFHSPRIAAEGTSNARHLPPRIQSSPNERKDSSRVSCQRGGSTCKSSLAISTVGGISASTEIRSGGIRFGSRLTKVSTAASASEVEA